MEAPLDGSTSKLGMMHTVSGYTAGFSSSHSGSFTPRTQRIGGWVGSKTGQEEKAKTKLPEYAGIHSNLRSSNLLPISLIKYPSTCKNKMNHI
jgi:hypothetical protein